MHDQIIADGPFEPTWESLRTFACPVWFRDAQLGIWSHWGPQGVPMLDGWYARNMYSEGSGPYRHHWRNYGHPTKFGYKDVVELWKAERFDPDALMELFVAAGARYFVALAVHHDNVDLWNSTHHRWNAVRMGPRKDIVGMWRQAARKRGLRFGVTEHLGAAFRWWVTNKGSDQQGPYAGVPYDSCDPGLADFYLPNGEEPRDGPCTAYTRNPWWHAQWLARIKDLVDQHQPDLLYSDGGVPFHRERWMWKDIPDPASPGRPPEDGLGYERVGLALIAHLYNNSASLHGGVNEAVYTQKDQDPKVGAVGVLDIERGMQSDIAAQPWQTDTCLGGWFYNRIQAYKTPEHIIGMLVNIVSKNGNLLLSVPLRPDGALDEECRYILARLADWMEVNGEGIFATRPWRLAGEGPSMRLEGGSFKEAVVEWTSADFRFTARGNTVYVFQMSWPDDGKACVGSLGGDAGLQVSAVDLLGGGGMAAFEQQDRALVIELPRQRTGGCAHCLRVQLSR